MVATMSCIGDRLCEGEANKVDEKEMECKN